MAMSEMDYMNGGGGDIGTLDSIIPYMTSATAPSGSVTASTYYGGGNYNPYYAFGGISQQVAYGWLIASGDTAQWIQYTYPSGTTKTAKMVMFNYRDNSAGCTCTKVEGYDGSTWTKLNDENITITKNEFVVAMLNNKTAYKAYKFTFTGMTTAGWGISIRLFGE